MNSNIVQEFLLNKRKFELKEEPTTHYRKVTPIADDLNVVLIVLFKDYNISFAKYFYYKDIYCCFELMSDQQHNCQNVTELFELVKKYDQPININDYLNQITVYRATCQDRIYSLSTENADLMKNITGAQRAMSMFGRQTVDWKAIANKLNGLQTKLSRNVKELEVLNKVAVSLANL